MSWDGTRGQQMPCHHSPISCLGPCLQFLSSFFLLFIFSLSRCAAGGEGRVGSSSAFTFAVEGSSTRRVRARRYLVSRTPLESRGLKTAFPLPKPWVNSYNFYTLLNATAHPQTRNEARPLQLNSLSTHLIRVAFDIISLTAWRRTRHLRGRQLLVLLDSFLQSTRRV